MLVTVGRTARASCEAECSWLLIFSSGMTVAGSLADCGYHHPRTKHVYPTARQLHKSSVARSETMPSL